jgi:cytochrome c oxidase subunit 4
MGYGLLNLGSFVFGLIAWIIPVINLVKRDKSGNRIWRLPSTASAIACSISLFMQILYGNYLVGIWDWAALMDTSNAVALMSSALITGTVALNIAMVAMYKKQETGQ